MIMLLFNILTKKKGKKPFLYIFSVNCPRVVENLIVFLHIITVYEIMDIARAFKVVKDQWQ